MYVIEMPRNYDELNRRVEYKYIWSTLSKEGKLSENELNRAILVYENPKLLDLLELTVLSMMGINVKLKAGTAKEEIMRIIRK